MIDVVCGVIEDESGRFLACLRPQGKHLGGLWEFPGGKVDRGESPENALVRELEEELGIIVSARDLTPETFASEPLDDRNLVLLLYRCVNWTGPPTPIYASDLQWALPEDMIALAMPPADYPLVRKLQGL